MEISKYLNIEIPALKEEQVRSFLAAKGLDIQSYITQEWDNYKTLQANAITETQIYELDCGPKDEVQEGKSTQKLDLPEENLEVSPSVDETLIQINEAIIVGETPDVMATISEIENNQDIEIIRSEKDESLTKQELERIEKEQKLLQEKEKKAAEAFNLQVKNKAIILPNAKVNQEYCFVFNIDELGLSEVDYYYFEGLDIVGLEYDSETHEIKGVPKLAGDFKIKLRIKRTDWTEGKPIFERDLNLIINPDPRDLWKSIPTPETIEYYKPDSDKKYIKVEAADGLWGMKKNVKKDIVAASQRGRSHGHEGIARDDDFGIDYCTKNGWYILAVADGAGSAKLSRKGSEIACKTVVEECKKLLGVQHKEFEHHIEEFNKNNNQENRKKVGDAIYHTIGMSVFRALKNIDEEARLTTKPIKDFSTTLIISIVKKFKFGWFIGAFWVGDGGIGIYHKDKQFVKILGESDGGEFAGQTRFLTMPEITQPTELYRRLRFEIVEDFTALVLMTDGITDPKFETDANLSRIEKWNELWNDISNEVKFTNDHATTANQLLSWLDFWSPGNHDDRTIAILH